MASNSVLAKVAVIFSANTAKLDQKLGITSQKLDKFNQALISTAKTLVGGFGVLTVFNALKSGIRVIADFEKQMSKVRAITGASAQEFEKLEKNALALGRSTEYTARQIASLQVEYGRLGFTTEEILNATEATLNLATATGEDLSRSAEIAGATLRAFQLDAKEMGRVTDVITGALNSSALALDSFADAMKFVAPNAKAVNVSIEETSALMSVLADSGLKGTVAGTSLRKIFTLLTRDGGTLQDRLKALAARGIDLADANDEVGLTAQTSLLVITKQLDKVAQLTKEFESLNGEAKRTADIMRDNLTGDVDKLTSAMEGLILEGSALNGLFRSLTQSGTNILNMLAGVRDATNEYERALAAFETKGSFRDRVFGKDLEGDIRVLNRLREAANLGSSGANAPNPQTGVVGAELMNQRIVDKALEEVEARKKSREEAEKLLKARREQFEVERKIFNLQLEGSKEKDLDFSEIEGIKQPSSGVGTLSTKISDLLNQDTQDAIDQFEQESQQAFDKIVEGADRVLENQEEARKSMMQTRDVAASLGESFGGFFGELAAGTLTAAQAAARGAAQIIGTLKQITLARMIANEAKFGIAGIIAAAAGFGLVESLFARIGSRGGSGGGGGGGLPSNFGRLDPVAAREQGIRVDVTGVLRGRDIEIQSTEQSRVSNRTKANG